MTMKSAVNRFALGLVLIVAYVTVIGCGQPTAPPVNMAATMPPVPAAPPPPPGPSADETAQPQPVAAVESQSRDDAVAAAEPRLAEGGGGGSEVGVEAAAQAGSAEAEAQAADAVPPGERLPNPFPRRFDVPDFSQGITWLNSAPLTKADLK